MNKNDLFSAFDELDDDILERSEAPAPRRKILSFRRWGALAACMALAVSLAGVAFAAEAAEYRAAAAFFEDNGLPVEGLSRADVKAVYRDITTQRFTYDKTAEVLERVVPGLEIDQREPTPEELEAAWNRNVWMNTQPGAGISYRTDHQYRPDEALGFDVFDKSILECYRDGELLWTAGFSKFYVEDSVYTSAGTAVWGGSYTWASYQTSYSWLARVDEGGNTLWQSQLDHGFKSEYISQVLDNGDGTWAVFSCGDIGHLFLSQYDMDGNELSFRGVMEDNFGIYNVNVTRLGDGYLVQLMSTSTEEPVRLVKLDREGDFLDSSSYEGKYCDYRITDMIEFGGRLYLSAYAVPKQTDLGWWRGEIADILDYIFNQDHWVSSEELTPMVRDNYTAVLLLCDTEGGAPETFYSVKGSLGGKLAVNDAGELVWDVESVVNTYFSPATSSFTIGGTCQVFRYTFDTAGNLLRQEDTGETAPYHR